MFIIYIYKWQYGVHHNQFMNIVNHIILFFNISYNMIKIFLIRIIIIVNCQLPNTREKIKNQNTIFDAQYLKTINGSLLFRKINILS